MSGTLKTHVQHMVLRVSGQKPTFAAPGVKPTDPQWGKYDIMPGMWAQNIVDDVWYYNDGKQIKAFTGNTQTEVLTVENVTVYNPDKPNDADGYAYYAGNTYVTYVNAESTETSFQTESIYRCVENALQGESPETHPAKWNNQGDTVEVGGGSLANIFYPNVEGIKAVTGYKDGNNVVDQSTGTIYRYNESAETGLQPNDNTGALGRWVQDGSLADKVPKTYTIDFQSTSHAAQDINMYGSGTITQLITDNIASVLLTYSGGVQQSIDPANPAISIEAGDVLCWEITRTTDGEPAALGVKLELN